MGIVVVRLVMATTMVAISMIIVAIMLVVMITLIIMTNSYCCYDEVESDEDAAMATIS